MLAIVTGHSRGLGAALAENLLGRGHAVLGIARSANDALGARFPALLQQVGLDLADPDALAAWLASGALERFVGDAGAALLINNAGLVQPIGPLGSLPAAAVVQAVTLNVAASLALANAFAAGATAARERRIVHVSSGAARSAYAGWNVYCASKAALDHHARAVALEAVPGLRICSLAPGVIDTAMQAEIRATSEARFPLRARFAALKDNAQLDRPERCAARLVDYALSAAFGAQVVADLRELG